MAEMKTRIEWLSELPLGYRERAAANCVEWNENKLTDECDEMADAIWGMCSWIDTSEGGDFWLAVWKHYINGTPLPPLPEIPSIAQLKAEIAALRQRIAELEAQVPKKPQPNWDEAPDWANWWAVEASGYAYWFQDDPVLVEECAAWDISLKMTKSRREKIINLNGFDWRETLTQRPE